MFMARAPGLTYKGLPVCVCADGELIPTEIDAGEVIGIFGPPTHYYYGSTDQCWHLNAARFAKFKAEIRHAGSIKTEDAQPPRGGWFAPMLARQVELS
jgi:hypothetical protein